MVFRLNDIIEASIGAFTGALFITATRSGNPIKLDPITGLIITIIWGWLLFKSAKRLTFGQNFFQNVAVTAVVAYFMARAFNLLEDVNIFSLEVFGSSLIVIVWIALPVALLFDKFNLTSPLARTFIRK